RPHLARIWRAATGMASETSPTILVAKERKSENAKSTEGTQDTIAAPSTQPVEPDHSHTAGFSRFRPFAFSRQRSSAAVRDEPAEELLSYPVAFWGLLACLLLLAAWLTMLGM